jgi:hypothetical protein
VSVLLECLALCFCVSDREFTKTRSSLRTISPNSPKYQTIIEAEINTNEYTTQCSALQFFLKTWKFLPRMSEQCSSVPFFSTNLLECNDERYESSVVIELNVRKSDLVSL